MKELQDECYQRLRETQKLSRSKANDYYDNRRFSQKVFPSPGTPFVSRLQLPDPGKEASGMPARRGADVCHSPLVSAASGRSRPALYAVGRSGFRRAGQRSRPCCARGKHWQPDFLQTPPTFAVCILPCP